VKPNEIYDLFTADPAATAAWSATVQKWHLLGFAFVELQWHGMSFAPCRFPVFNSITQHVHTLLILIIYIYIYIYYITSISSANVHQHYIMKNAYIVMPLWCNLSCGSEIA
jgi:hypothetical protein